MTQQPLILSTLISFFEQVDWAYSRHETELILNMAFAGENGQWVCRAQVASEIDSFVFYSISPMRVPDKQRTMVSEYITRVNYGLIVGNFEMDFTDGEVRFKTSSIVLPDEVLNLQTIKYMVSSNVLMMDHYLPGMMQVTYAHISPEQAIAQIEDQSIF